MHVIVNGERLDLADGVTLAELVERSAPCSQGVAAAVDGVVVPRDGWRGLVLRDGQTVELVTAVQGG